VRPMRWRKRSPGQRSQGLRSQLAACEFSIEALRSCRRIWNSAGMDGWTRFGHLFFQLFKVVGFERRMKPRIKSFLLTSFFVVGAAAAVATHFWRERVEAEFDPKPLYTVIAAQFEACRTDDFGKAYNQASSGVQERFTLVQYVSKIRTEYARISQPRTLQFGSASLDNRRAIVEVYFQSQNGQVTPALFTMIQEHGIWRIENFEVFETWPLDRRLAGYSV
jgi:Domain of unknown function (DUF4864)